jgi:hypothetical protein
MAIVPGGTGSTIVPWIVLVLVAINILFLLTEIGINVLGAMLPLQPAL